MNNLFSESGISILRTMLDTRIIRVRRQLFSGDSELADFQQNGDGPVEFTFDTGSIVHFLADTETFSVVVCDGEMPVYGEGYALLDLTCNEFWSSRVRKKIRGVRIVRSHDFDESYLCEFGVEIALNDGCGFFIEYIDELENSDMIRVSDRYICGSGIEKNI